MDAPPPAVAELNASIEFHIVNSLGWQQLRPLQRDAIGPVRSGADCVLVAPTAGGKTEAALFPLLSEMIEKDWRSTSILYVTPLKALLNNLHPRLESYTHWLGRTTALWHGDIADSVRRRILENRPDILLTTPESLESMLVSRRVDHRALFSGVRAIVVDELHAFAGQDRGWHLLAVLERIQRLAERPIQRVGLSATVGNPHEMVAWLQGAATDRPREVVLESSASLADPAVTLDFVGSESNAAIIIAALHPGEKRLVFVESRATAENIAFELRELGVETFVSHSSLSVDERRQSERAFSEAQNCVIVATSTLELGIDIGDLDRVIQIDAPRTVASFLQRLGRTGRRAGGVRNTLFLSLTEGALVRAASLLVLWERGFVEPVVPPPHPRHLAAQQFLALALQEGRFGISQWASWWGTLGVMADGDEVLAYLRSEEFLVEDSGFLFIGPRAEREFGRRNFIELLATFVADLEIRVVAGTKEIGKVSPLSLTQRILDGEEFMLLAGRAWRVELFDEKRHMVLVVQQPIKGKIRWPGGAPIESYELCQAQRDVLLGASPSVTISGRARMKLDEARANHRTDVDAAGLVLVEGKNRSTLWTWAGLRANETLRAALGNPEGASDNPYLTLPPHIGANEIRAALCEDAVPLVSPELITGLKFSAALPMPLARRTIGERLADRVGASQTALQAIVVRQASEGDSSDA